MLDVGQGYKNTIAKAKRISGGGDAAGRRVSRNADSFSYNARSEVIGAVIGTNDYGYAYDAIGNRIATTEDTKTTEYLANELNQYTQISVPSVSSVVNPTYDADGNMTRLGDWRHTWDAENRLVRSEPYGFATNGAVRLEYVYNHKNLRVAKIKKRLSGRGADYPFNPSQPGTWDVIETRRYVWDGYNIAAEIVIDEVTPSTNVTYYVWGTDLSGTLQGAGGVGGLLAVIRPDGTFFPCYDANGNVTYYVDGAGNIRAHYKYSPFGEIVVQSGDLADTFKFRFSTKYWDEETRSYYYGYRHYAPKLGCWLSKDPIGEEGGLNLYAICENNLLDRFDPTGETWTTNWEFFWDWVLERGEENRIYGTGTVELEEMQSSPGAKHMRRTYKAGGCKTIKNGSFGTAKAYFTTIWFPNKTAFQVGGFLYDAVNNGDGTVTYSIRNQASAYSFFLHIPGVPHKPRGGTIRLFGNINQTFIFTEKSPCCDKKKEGK